MHKITFFLDVATGQSHFISSVDDTVSPVVIGIQAVPLIENDVVLVITDSKVQLKRLSFSPNSSFIWKETSSAVIRNLLNLMFNYQAKLSVYKIQNPLVQNVETHFVIRNCDQALFDSMASDHIVAAPKAPVVETPASVPENTQTAAIVSKNEFTFSIIPVGQYHPENVLEDIFENNVGITTMSNLVKSLRTSELILREQLLQSTIVVINRAGKEIRLYAIYDVDKRVYYVATLPHSASKHGNLILANKNNGRHYLFSNLVEVGEFLEVATASLYNKVSKYGVSTCIIRRQNDKSSQWVIYGGMHATATSALIASIGKDTAEKKAMATNESTNTASGVPLLYWLCTDVNQLGNGVDCYDSKTMMGTLNELGITAPEFYAHLWSNRFKLTKGWFLINGYYVKPISYDTSDEQLIGIEYGTFGSKDKMVFGFPTLAQAATYTAKTVYEIRQLCENNQIIDDGNTTMRRIGYLNK